MLEVQHNDPTACIRPFIFDLSEEQAVDAAVEKAKRKIYNVIRPLMSQTTVSSVIAGLLGGHSVQKFAFSTTARASGISKDDHDQRARWRATQ